MLESYAFQIMSQSEEILALAGIGVMIGGYIFALIMRQGGTMTMKRVPYFIASGAAYLCLAALPLAWLLTFEAIQRDLLWALVAFVFGGMFVFGLAGGIFSHARAVSAWGTGERAWWGLIPILNLVLYFKRPMHEGPKEFGQGARNFMGFTIGVALLGLGVAMDILVKEQTEAFSVEMAINEGMQEQSTDKMVQALGLEAALQQIARDTPGQQVDDITLLQGVRSDGSVLRFHYQVETDELLLPDQVKLEIAQATCDDKPIYSAIRAGGVIESVYVRDDGLELGRVTVTRESCSY